MEVNGYVLEFDRGGQRVYWPEALPAGVAFAAAGQMRRDGLNPKIIRISICARILSSGIVVTEPHAKRNTE